MIYAFARFANSEHTFVTGTDADGNSETVPVDFVLFRQPEHGPQGFIAAGGVIAEYVASPATLPDLAPWQFFAMLELSGKKPDLDAFIEALPEPDKIVAKAKLDKSLTFQRDNDLVLAAQQAVGLTDEALDDLWAQALAL